MVDGALDHVSAGSNTSLIVYAETYTKEERKGSELAKRNHTVIKGEDTAINFTKEGEGKTTVKLYNYTSQKTSENLSEYSEIIRENYRVKLDSSNLSRPSGQGNRRNILWRRNRRT